MSKLTPCQKHVFRELKRPKIAHDQKNEVKRILRNNNFYINEVVKDFANKDRCIISTKI